MTNSIKRKINSTEFNKNIFTLITGTSLAQILPVAVSPILSRLYSPSDFGVLAIFFSITSIFGTVINGRYELAVILPENDSDAINILALGVLISSVSSSLLLLFVLFFHDTIVIWVGNNDISAWLYVAPFVIFFLGLFNMLNYYSTRKKYYKNIAQSNIIKSTTTVAVQLVFSFFKNGTIGLVGGYSVGHLFGNYRLLKNILAEKESISKIKKEDIIIQAKRYARFPKFTLPASFSNIMAIELTNILISKIFNIATLGFYSLANRVLNVPSSFIGQSISQVYYQEAADEKKKTGKAIKTFKSMVFKLFVVGFPFFFIIFFISEWLFTFVFGVTWASAGTFAKIITPLLFIRFLVSPVSVSLSIFEKQHVSLIWQIGLLIITLSIIGVSLVLKISFIYFLYTYVVILSFYYLILLGILFKLVR